YNHRTTFAFGEKTSKPKYIRKKADYDTSPKQKPVQATKGTKIKSKAKVSKPDKKKQPTKKPKAKGLAVLSEFALTEAEQLKLATKRSKKDFHISHANGSSDRVDTLSKVPDEQHLETTSADEGTGTIPGAPDVPIYEYESEKESWGDSEDEDNENDSDDISDEGDNDNNGNNGDDDANDDDKQEGDDTNDDDEENDSDRTESDKIKISIFDQSSIGYYEEEEEKINDEEMMDEEEDDESGFEQEEKDAHVTLTPVLDIQKSGGPTQSSSVSSDFASKLLNLDNPSLADNEIASLMDTTAQHATAIHEITSSFTITIPPQPPFFNPLLQQATPTPTPTTSEATTSVPSLLDFSSVFRFNDRVTNLEKDLSEIKQILPQAVSDFVNPVIEKNITGSVEAAVLTRSSSQLTSTDEAAASLFEGVEMKETKIKTPLLDQTEGQKEENRVKLLSPPEIQGQSKRSLQAPLKTPPNLNISLPA
ncbi:hypothetical protein Tco_0964599, partial [Tanacetum coccineum]